MGRTKTNDGLSQSEIAELIAIAAQAEVIGTIALGIARGWVKRPARRKSKGGGQ